MHCSTTSSRTAISIWVVLLFCVWGRVEATAQPLPHTVGIFADQAGTLSTIDTAASTPFTVYVVGFGLDGQVKGYEVQMSVPANHFLLSAVPNPPSALNFGDVDGEFIVGTGSCFEGVPTYTLVTATLLPLVPAVDGTICVSGTNPTSFGGLPGYLQCDGTKSVLTPAQYGGEWYPDGCLVMNPTHPGPVVGPGPATVAVRPDTLDFGLFAIGGPIRKNLVVANEDSTQVPTADGQLTPQCPEVSLVQGDGSFSLAPGESMSVDLEVFSDTPGSLNCQITTSALPAEIPVRGEAIDPYSDSILDFHTVAVGAYAAQWLTVTNTTTGVQTLGGQVTSPCAEFIVIAGGEPFSLAPGESKDVLVWFLPTQPGDFDCFLETGIPGGKVRCVGQGQVPPKCRLTKTAIDFGPHIVGEVVEDTLFVANDGGGPLVGTLSLAGEGCSLREGEGPYFVPGGDSLRVILEFQPSAPGSTRCDLINDSYFCPTVVPVTGTAATGPRFASPEPDTIDGSTRHVAWVDYDRDGDPDLYVGRVGLPDALFRNESGVLVEVPWPAVGGSASPTNSVWFDYDGNDYPDPFITYPSDPNRLFANLGSFGFAEVTLDPLTGPADSRSATVADYDLDGDVDLFVATAAAAPNQLYRNDWPNGFFTEATPPELSEPTSSLAGLWADYDNDGDADLYVLRWGEANQLFRNDGGSFVDVTAPPLDDPGNSMDAAWGDYDNDGDLDLYLTRRDGPNRLFRNDGSAGFVDATPPLLADAGLDGDVSWIDTDNDGDLDLFYAGAPGPNGLFINESGNFFDGRSLGVSLPENHAAAAWADVDMDGDLDLYLGEWDAGGQNVLVRNETANGNHWLGVDLYSLVSNRAGIGARVRVVAGGKSQYREVGAQSGARSKGPLRLHFGLGSSATIDSLIILWPSGSRQIGTNLSVDRVIRPGEDGSVTAVDPPNSDLPTRTRLVGAMPNPFNPRTELAFDLAEEAEVEIAIYDVAGRRVRLLLGQRLPAGRHRVVWKGEDEAGRRVASGIYFARLRAAGVVQSTRLTLVK